MQTSWGRGEATGMEWQSSSLAVAMGHDRQGGDRVFHMIDGVLSNPRRHLDLLELFQNILDRGFRGRYRFDSDSSQRLLNIRERLQSVAAVAEQDASHDDRANAPAGHLDLANRGEASDGLSTGTTDQREHSVGWGLRRRWIVGGIATALLLGAGSFVAVGEFFRDTEPVPGASPIDRLGEQLRQQLRDEIAAGNVELIRNVAADTLRLRFNGMYAPGDVIVAPWWASMMASVGRTIATSAATPDVLVAGYTDSRPVSAIHQRSNLALSEERARQIAQILMAAGVPKEHISVAGHSDADPLADNASEEGRSRNRRIEVTVSNCCM